ncbi:MAG: hypothetical protein OSJ46_09895 [Duncaniella sp.]|nr:hypothetical protein [Duncaniella sp.]
MPFTSPLAGDNKRFDIAVTPYKQIIAEWKAVTAYKRARCRGSELRLEIFVMFHVFLQFKNSAFLPH